MCTINVPRLSSNKVMHTYHCCLLGGPSSIAYQYQEEPTSIIALLWGPQKWPTACTERFIIVGWAWASNTQLMFYFVMAHSRIVMIYCLGYKIDKSNLLMHNNYQVLTKGIGITNCMQWHFSVYDCDGVSWQDRSKMWTILESGTSDPLMWTVSQAQNDSTRLH